MTDDLTTEQNHLGRMLAFIVTCPSCDGVFIVGADDRMRLTACPYCMARLPVAELEKGRVQ